MWTLLLGLVWAALPSVDEPVRTGAVAPDDAAVVVGIEDYVFLPDVPYAANDARAVRDWLVSTRGVAPEKVERLDQAGREQILAAVDRASAASGTVWIYLAGHGVAAPSSGERLFLGDDARQDPTAFEARGVSLAELQERAGSHGADVVLLVDACFNGRARGGGTVSEGTRFAIPVYTSDVDDNDLRLSASGPDQLARPLPEAEHGAFTYTLLGALRGWADGEIDGTPDGEVSAREAQVYMQRALPRLGIVDQEPALDGRSDRILASGSLEPKPQLERSSGTDEPEPVAAPVVSASPQPQRSSPELLARFDPDLVAAADMYRVTLPLVQGPFGYRDANDQRVRRDALMKLQRSTKKGRTGTTLAAIGGASMAVGASSAMGATIYTFASGSATPGVYAVGGTGCVALASGLVMAIAGNGMAKSSLNPR